ncbi:MAG: hypothetical protein N3G20_06835, partial [Verrucomicrobiae bacterium]|nr:hypothetical protein [Verrucomicrobiae bacterium]
ALNNQFWIEQKTTASDVWRNLSQPRAQGGLIGCNVNTSKKDVVPEGFEFLANITEQPDTAVPLAGTGGVDYRCAVGEATLLRHLAPLRSGRVWLPDASAPANITNIRIHRVMASGGHDAVVEFQR